MARLKTSIIHDLETSIDNLREYGNRQDTSSKRIITFYMHQYNALLAELQAHGHASAHAQYEHMRNHLYIERPALAEHAQHIKDVAALQLP